MAPFRLGFRVCDRRYPFLWSQSGQPGGRWNRPGDPPRHYLASSPLVAWAEWLRHQEIHDPEDLEGVAAALWAVLMPPDWGPEILPLVDLPETVVLAEGAEALEQRRAADHPPAAAGCPGPAGTHGGPDRTLLPPLPPLRRWAGGPGGAGGAAAGVRALVPSGKPAGLALREGGPPLAGIAAFGAAAGGRHTEPMNRLAPVTPASAATVNEALLRQLADEIRKEIPEAEVRLFGSRARGDARPDSDIDLLITVTDDWLADHNRFEVLDRLRWRLSEPRRPVDLLLFSRSQVEHRRQLRSSVVHQAYTHGRRLDG